MVSFAELRAGGFPDDAGPDRQHAIVEAVAQGHHVPLSVSHVESMMPGPDGGTVIAELAIADEPLAIGSPEDSVYPMVSQRTVSELSSLLGTVQLTPKLMDLMANRALLGGGGRWVDAQGDWESGGFDPIWQPVADMSTDAMVIYTERLRARFGPGSGPVISTGKQWVVSSRLTKPGLLKFGDHTAINYGGHTEQPGHPTSVSAVGVNVIQPPGAAHSVDHVDYSQLYQPVGREVMVRSVDHQGELLTEVFTDIDNVAASPDLWPLIHHDGPMLMRHPGEPFAGGPGGGGGGIGPVGPTGIGSGKKRNLTMALLGFAVSTAASLGVYRLHEKWPRV